MSPVRYLPVLSDKQAEMHALAEMAPQTRSIVAPLVDLRNPRPPDNRRPGWTPESALTKRISDPNDGIMGCWGVDDEIMIDGRRLDPRTFDLHVHPIEYAFQRCVDSGVRVVPVTGRLRDQASRDAVARSMSLVGGRAAIRLRDHDLYAGTDGVSVLLRELDLPKSAVDLILDFQHVEPSSTFMTASTAHHCLERLAPLTSWNSVSVVAGAFPMDLSKVMGYNEMAVFARADRSVWLQASSRLANVGLLRFGDYGILSASDADETPYRGSANVRYTTDVGWQVHRGFSRDKQAPDDYARLAGEVVRLETWRGNDHCPGCSFLAEHASSGHGGNATQYRRAGMTHHFAVVVEELAFAA